MSQFKRLAAGRRTGLPVPGSWASHPGSHHPYCHKHAGDASSTNPREAHPPTCPSQQARPPGCCCAAAPASVPAAAGAGAAAAGAAGPPAVPAAPAGTAPAAASPFSTAASSASTSAASLSPGGSTLACGCPGLAGAAAGAAVCRGAVPGAAAAKAAGTAGVTTSPPAVAGPAVASAGSQRGLLRAMHAAYRCSVEDRQWQATPPAPPFAAPRSEHAPAVCGAASSSPSGVCRGTGEACWAVALAAVACAAAWAPALLPGGSAWVGAAAATCGNKAHF